MGLMTARHASINETPIGPEERKLHWPLGSSLMLAWLDRS
jgi:nuclear transport factor 2 (NTF2) superfamily protein